MPTIIDAAPVKQAQLDDANLDEHSCKRTANLKSGGPLTSAIVSNPATDAATASRSITLSQSFYKSNSIDLYLGDAAQIMSQLGDRSIDCIVTSPPYYGQRDYGIEGQLGLESHPQMYINKLVAVFREARRVLKPSGSLWVNIGDTYWSGKGKPHGPDKKQKNRRFDRPQDKAGARPWCAPKQLLLIPHRFAVAMQDEGWIVRNDNVWHKPSPTPDPVDDRCALTHEYVFHFVKQRRYYFHLEAVAMPSTGKRAIKPPPSVWTIATVPSQKRHIAVFPDQLMLLPILATCPPNGVVLDPFCGSGTALLATLALGEGRKAIGIDLSPSGLKEARDALSPHATHSLGTARRSQACP